MNNIMTGVPLERPDIAHRIGGRDEAIVAVVLEGRDVRSSFEPIQTANRVAVAIVVGLGSGLGKITWRADDLEGQVALVIDRLDYIGGLAAAHGFRLAD